MAQECSACLQHRVDRDETPDTTSARCASPACVRLLQVVVPRDFYAELANGSGSGHLDVGMVEQVTCL